MARRQLNLTLVWLTFILLGHMSEISMIENPQAEGLTAMAPSESMTNGSSHDILNILGARLVTNELLVDDKETSYSFLENGSSVKERPDDYASLFGRLSEVKDDRRSYESC